MKPILNFLIVMALTGLSSCITEEGPEGPMGPEGEQGPKGESGFVFEFENIDFIAPNYESFLSYPGNFESLSSDVALVYLLWDVVKVDGKDTEVWRQLPQTILTDKGILQYNFDFSMNDVRLFMDADFDLGQLGAIDTDNWVARVVVVPGDFWNSGRLSSHDFEYNELKETLGLPDLPTPKSSIRRK